MNVRELFRNFDSAKTTAKTRKNSLFYGKFEVSSGRKIKKKTKNVRSSSNKKTKSSLLSLLGIRQSSMTIFPPDEQQVEDKRLYKSQRKNKELTNVIQKIKRASSTDLPFEKYQKKIGFLLSQISGGNMMLSKNSFTSVVGSMLGYMEKMNSKHSREMADASTQTDEPRFDRFEQIAKKSLIEDKEDDTLPESDQKIVKLTQKSIILDEMLEVLKEEGIDLNHMLSIIIEKIEATFFVPPSDISLVSGVDLDLEDRMKMPTPTWKREDLPNSFHLDLKNILECAELHDSSRSSSIVQAPASSTKKNLKNKLLRGYEDIAKRIEGKQQNDSKNVKFVENEPLQLQCARKPFRKQNEG